MMSGPGEGASFAQCVQWLLSSVRSPAGSADRLSMDDLLAALSAVAGDSPHDHQPVSTRSAQRLADGRQWLDSVNALPVEVAAARRESQAYLTALEYLFRLPSGYFADAQLRRDTDECVALAALAADRQITWRICRTPTEGISMRERSTLLSTMLFIGPAQQDD
jgi:hypothetical protein